MLKTLNGLHSFQQIGDIVDARDVTMGAWFEAKIMKIRRAEPEDDCEEPLAKPLENSEDESESKLSETKNNVTKSETENIVITDEGKTSASNTETGESSRQGEKTTKSESTDTVKENSESKPNDTDKSNSDEVKKENLDESNNNNVDESDKVQQQLEKVLTETKVKSDVTSTRPVIHVCDANDGFVYSVQYEG